MCYRAAIEAVDFAPMIHPFEKQFGHKQGEVFSLIYAQIVFIINKKLLSLKNCMSKIESH
jgi:hypothetical protein